MHWGYFPNCVVNFTLYKKIKIKWWTDLLATCARACLGDTGFFRRSACSSELCQTTADFCDSSFSTVQDLHSVSLEIMRVMLALTVCVLMVWRGDAYPLAFISSRLKFGVLGLFPLSICKIGTIIGLGFPSLESRKETTGL